MCVNGGLSGGRCGRLTRFVVAPLLLFPPGIITVFHFYVKNTYGLLTRFTVVTMALASDAAHNTCSLLGGKRRHADHSACPPLSLCCVLSLDRMRPSPYLLWLLRLAHEMLHVALVLPLPRKGNMQITQRALPGLWAVLPF